jgi:hypothetical protein
MEGHDRHSTITAAMGRSGNNTACVLSKAALVMMALELAKSFARLATVQRDEPGPVT